MHIYVYIYIYIVRTMKQSLRHPSPANHVANLFPIGQRLNGLEMGLDCPGEVAEVVTGDNPERRLHNIIAKAVRQEHLDIGRDGLQETFLQVALAGLDALFYHIRRKFLLAKECKM